MRASRAVWRRLGSKGRVVIPARFRRALALDAGDEILVSLDLHRGLRLLTPRQAILRAQRLVTSHVRRKRRLSVELLDDRKQHG